MDFNYNHYKTADTNVTLEKPQLLIIPLRVIFTEYKVEVHSELMNFGEILHLMQLIYANHLRADISLGTTDKKLFLAKKGKLLHPDMLTSSFLGKTLSPSWCLFIHNTSKNILLQNSIRLEDRITETAHYF